MFADYPGVEVDSAGLNHDAVVPLSPEQLQAADIIFVMEKAHRIKLSKRFGKHLNRQRVICLNIPDNYQYMDESLVEILQQRIPKYI